MRVKPTALLSAVVVCAVSCATGTGDELLTGVPAGGDAGGSGADAGPSAGDGDTVSVSIPRLPTAGSEVMGAYALDVSCASIPVFDVCLLSSTSDEDVTYILPPGTKRSSIVYTVTPQGPSAGGTVDFAGADPLDGTVHLHGFADAFSSVHIAVTGVMIVPE